MNKTQVMKTILVTLFFLFIGISAQAQKKDKEVKVTTTTIALVRYSSYETSTARLYKHKDSQIKKELTFDTKANELKLA